MFDYEALCAKCRAAYGGMLKYEDYDQLASSSSLLAEAERLSEMNGYREVFDGVDMKGINRSFIEYAAAHRYFDLIVRLASFAGGRPADFLRKIAEEYEIRYLVRVLYLLVCKDGEIYTAVPDYMRKYSHIDFVRLVTCKSNKEIISHLKDTRYYPAALSELSKERPDISHLEAIWYGEYYDDLYGKSIDALDKVSREEVRTLYRTRSLLIKERAEIRAQKYGFPDEQTKASGILYDGGEVKKRKKGASSAEKEMYDICVSELHTGRNSMAVAVALVMIAENEFNNIIHLTEGIRYGVSKDVIMEKLICR